MVKAYEEIGEYVDGQDGIQMYEQLGEVLAFLLLSKSRDQISYLQDSLLDQIKKISEKYEDMLYFIGVGNPKHHIREIWYSYEQASSVFSHRFMESQSRVYFYSAEREDDIDIGGMDVGKLDRKVLNNFLSTGEKNELDSFLNEYFQSLGEANLKSTFFRQYIVTDVYFTVVALLEEVHATKEQAMAICGSMKDGAKSLGNLEETKTYVRELLLKVMDARAQMAKQKYGSMIQDAKEYIHANYNDEGMSLNQVAAYVNVSPNHFSTVFRQETGENFIEYLTSVRLEHAKEMLRTTSRKTSEIGYEVGYKDPHYFSSLFKKVEGMTPKEYRGGNVG
jgi:two-component system response regulator YesN